MARKDPGIIVNLLQLYIDRVKDGSIIPTWKIRPAHTAGKEGISAKETASTIEAYASSGMARGMDNLER